eukprot:CAMPEP_0113462638 /NCGR_PEP_ID=MMETSP0014_2-20120614/12208_1 /TAXON_ID=2857 /ORGANISM="Nitzschia sp." /LENGTH=217 /DNA_ID=CAMNT_0000354533 /DNA_START=168 /DNA_END=821 /DNA_ORIENTATION=- /assembly_acc=CAM_ASM_000159
MMMMMMIVATSFVIRNVGVDAFSTRAPTAQSSARRIISFQLYAEEDGAAAAAAVAPASTYATCGSCGSSYAITEDDLTQGGGRNGRRLECSVCGHSWFQSSNRILSLGDGFEMIPLPEKDMERIQLNLKEGRQPKFAGEMKLYVGNMAFATTEEDLWQLFGSIGTVGDVSLVRDDQGRNRGFGFVTMREKAESVKALEQFDGMDFNGRNLNVRESTN